MPGGEVGSEGGLLWKRGKEKKRMTVLLQALRKPSSRFEHGNQGRRVAAQEGAD